MMSNYKCTKCPETMYSKCPWSRTVFPKHEYVTMVKNAIIKKVKPYNEHTDDVALHLEYGRYPSERTAEEAFAYMVGEIRRMSDEDAAILVCNHDWYLPGDATCSLDGHDHNRADEVIKEEACTD